MLPPKELKKKSRGFAEEMVSSDGVSLVRWLDNKPVSLASNFDGIDPITNVLRYDRKAQAKIDIPRPAVITMYNQSMGGVDKMDMLVSIYRIFIKSRKWTLRAIYHAIDIAAVNS